jgi:hypothetical protein
MSQPRSIIGAGSVEMPDLSGLVGRNVPALITFTLAESGLRAPDRYYLSGLALITDRAAYVYERARANLSIAAAESGSENEVPIGSIVRGADYLEFAINSILRAQLLGERLRRSLYGPSIGRHELLSSAELGQVRKLRHFAEHVDDRIPAGLIGETGTSALVFRTMADCIEYAGDTVTYVAIAGWITRLHALASRLLS